MCLVFSLSIMTILSHHSININSPCQKLANYKVVLFCSTSSLVCCQVFVANPNKPRPIQEILLRNREKLIEFLSKFHNDRSEDDQFNDEKAYLIKQIKEMKPLDVAPY